MQIGFIGCGKMGSALLRGITGAGVAPETLHVTDAVTGAAKALGAATGARIHADNAGLAAACEVVVLCVKPNDAIAALREAQAGLEGKLLISIVAGLKIDTLQEAAGLSVRVVRVMPNTPALLGAGASAYAAGSGVTKQDADFVEKLLRPAGIVAAIKEDLLDAVTGLSGSGPAYIYMVIEALADGGVRMGLPRALAIEFAAQTALGAAKMVLESGKHPAELRDQVTSPGGTTIAGLTTLESHGVRSAFIEAVTSATLRSRELGKLS